MLLPSIFGNDFFDDFMNFPTNFGRGRERAEQDFGAIGGLMRTDVKENETGYEIHMDLPGFRKEDVKASLKDGYLTVTATRESKVDEDKKEKYIRRERYMGSVTRSFYVGDQLTEEDIKARFEDGILKLTLPKKEFQKVKEDRYIAIEG